MNKRIIATITGLAVAAMIVVPSSASALTSAELQLQINQLLNQLNNLQQQLADMGGSGTTGGTVTGCSITSFTMNLKVGDSGQAVKCLQVILNSAADTQLSAGAGSPGNETEYFGPKTKEAVIKFQEKYASEVLASFGLTSGTGYVGTTTRAKLNTMISSGSNNGGTDNGGTVIPPVTGTGLRVALSSDNPASGTLVDGQGLATLAKLVFTNGDSAEAKVTRINLKRIGVSADATLTNVYAFLGQKRLTDASSVSSGVINLNDSAGLFTVPAGGSVIISIKADVDGTAGETMGVSVNAATDVTTTATSVNGTFPINGNLFTLATATLAGVNFASSTTPTTNTSLAPQDNYTVWQNTVTFTTRAVDFTRISFRKIGSTANTDLGNFKLYIAGVQVGSTVASLDANGYVTFDLSASPKRIEAGSHIIKLVADIIDGSNLNFYFSIRNSADANFTDTQYNVEVLPQSNSGTFTVSHVTAGTQTVSSGTLTVTKTADSPSGNKVNGAPNVTLAKYELKAAGEPVKIDTLYVAAVCSRGGTTAATQVGYLRNGMLLANGVQIGSTKNLNCTTYSTTYQTFPLGSSLIVTPGSPVILEVRADMYDNDGTDNMTADDTISARLVGSSSWENGLGQVSSTSIDVPASNKDGNQVTVKEGALTLSKYTAYTDQTAVAPVNDYKLGHFTLSADTTEAVNISTITVTLNAVSGFATDLYVKYGTQETSHVSTVSTAANAFSVNYSLAAGQTIDIEVYSDVATGVDSGTGVANVEVTGTTADSATAVTGTALDGQTITFTTGSIVSAVGAGMPLNQLVVGNQTVTAGKFKFTAANDDYTIREVQIALDDTDDITSAVPSSVIISAILKDGTTVLGTKAFADTTIGVNDTATFTGLGSSRVVNGVTVPALVVPANTSKTLTVDLVLSTPSSTASNSQINAFVTMTYFEYANSQGTISNNGTDRVGNELYVFKSIPVVNKSTVTKTTLGAGTNVDLYKWTVGSEGKGTGSIAIRQMKLSLTWADTDQSLMELESMKLYKGSTNITSLVTIRDEDANDLESTSGATSTSSTVIITFATEDVIADGDTATYTLKATAQGFVAKANTSADDKVTIYLLDDATVNGATKYIQNNSSITQLVNSGNTGDADANFIWSDNSAVSHSSTSASSSGDWSNGYLVQNLPLSSEQWVGQ